MPLFIVLVTDEPRSTAPRNSNIPAIITAWNIVMALEPTEVANEFACKQHFFPPYWHTFHTRAGCLFQTANEWGRNSFMTFVDRHWQFGLESILEEICTMSLAPRPKLNTNAAMTDRTSIHVYWSKIASITEILFAVYPLVLPFRRTWNDANLPPFHHASHRYPTLHSRFHLHSGTCQNQDE